MKKNRIFIPIFAVLAVSGLWLLWGKTDCQAMECLSFNDSNKYELRQVYEESEYIYRGLYEDDGVLIRLEVKPDYSREKADKAILLQTVRTEGVFEDAAAPYPGEISNVISCGEEYKPEKSIGGKNGFPVTYFEYFTNERMVPGACTTDQAVYHATLAMFLCEKQGKFYQLELIVPVKAREEEPEKYRALLDSISCK